MTDLRGDSKGDDHVKKAGKNLTKKTSEAISRDVQDIKSTAVPPALVGDLRSLIESARVRVAIGVNAEMVLLYWDIGERIRKEILGKNVQRTVNRCSIFYPKNWSRSMVLVLPVPICSTWYGLRKYFPTGQ